MECWPRGREKRNYLNKWKKPPRKSINMTKRTVGKKKNIKN